MAVDCDNVGEPVHDLRRREQEEQLGEGIVDEVVWNFSQNGLVAYNNGNLLESNSISKHLGEDNIKRIVNWVMKYLADVDLPIKVSKLKLGICE